MAVFMPSVKGLGYDFQTVDIFQIDLHLTIYDRLDYHVVMVNNRDLGILNIIQCVNNLINDIAPRSRTYCNQWYNLFIIRQGTGANRTQTVIFPFVINNSHT